MKTASTALLTIALATASAPAASSPVIGCVPFKPELWAKACPADDLHHESWLSGLFDSVPDLDWFAEPGPSWLTPEFSLNAEPILPPLEWSEEEPAFDLGAMQNEEQAEPGEVRELGPEKRS